MSNQSPPRKLGVQHRFADVKRDALDVEARSLSVAFSSELPVERYWGKEVLDHSPSSVRLGRLEGGGAVLVDHDPADHVGVVESVQIDGDRKGRAVLRFGKSQRAQEIWQDVVDGIRRHVSVGYAIHRMAVDKPGKGGEPDAYRVVDWEPLEISLVAIPADPTVGVGRSAREFDVEIETVTETPVQETRAMTDERNEQPAPVNIEAVRNEARDAEMARVREILALGQAHNRRDMADKAVTEGVSIDAFRGDLLIELSKGSKQVQASPEIGMTPKEIRQFSIVRAINALANPNDRRAQDAAGFEFEASRAAAEKYGKQSRGLTLPHDVVGYRDLITGTTTGTAKGGNLVATDLLAGSFIDILRNAMVLPRVGATFLTGLQGNVAIPKKTTASTSYWVAENSAPTEGALVFGQVTMTPKTLAAFVDFSRRLSIQSSIDIENLVRNDLATGIAVALDEAALGGAKTNGPTGVRGTSGIGSVAIGTNGGAPTWASIVNLIREVEVDNALTGAAAFVTNPKVKAKLMSTPKQASGVEGNFLLGPPYDNLAGYPFVVSNQIPSNLTKGGTSGTCSAMLFGVWSDLVIGQWSGIDLMVDPYTGSSAATTRVTAFVDTDVAVRYAESFAAVLDYTTT
jgi:HK97 family phage major capsid protein